jgi:flagellar hook-associated protein 1 FlgK
MSNLLASLLTSANALSAYDKVLAVTQNNVANASTPGYAKQTVRLDAMPLDIDTGSLGGVRAGEVVSSRNQYAEQAVRRQNVLLGSANQEVNSLQALQSFFDISGQSGITAALDRLYQSFSAWGQSPTDATARLNVIDRAGEVAGAFQQTADGLANLSDDTGQQIQQTVAQVNSIIDKLQSWNQQIMGGAKNDAGIDAQVNALLEDLSQYIDFTASVQDDGSVAVLMNGQTPLLLEDRKYQLSAVLKVPTGDAVVYPDAAPSAHILAADGTDITAKTTDGQLGALLRMRNEVLPSDLGDAYQPGDLNTMAKQFAARVNQLLQSGYVSDGDPPVLGAALFQYDATNDTKVAQSLKVDPSVTAGQLASIDPGPPYVFNGIPLALAALAAPQKDADRINGASYSGFYGAMAARAGSALNEAQDQQEVRQGMVAQAKTLRQDLSGVSLDQEATILIQFQRAYQANSRFITVLNQLTETAINILQP